jgi:ketosteroid isomerase-like protein
LFEKGVNTLSEQNKAIVRRYFEEATQGNERAIDELLDADVVLHFPGSSGPVRGRAGYKNMIKAYRGGSPELVVKLVDMHEDGDTITVSWTATFRHSGKFKDHPPTGKHGTITGRDIIRLRNGKIVEINDEVDFDALQSQLGFRPTLD